MKDKPAHTVQEYLENLPPDRRRSISKVRETILANLPEGYEEGMQFGMISYHIPLLRYPGSYNKQPLSYAALASQKNYMSLYLMCIYGSPALRERFEAEYQASGKKLDMGKSCLRFTKLDDLPLDVIGRTIAQTPVEAYLEQYEKSLEERKGQPPLT